MELEERARDSHDNCVACTSCIAACPVTKANPNYKGPKLVGPAHSRMHFSDPSDYEDSLKLCSNCKNCDITCPNGVSVATLNMLERAKYYKAHPEAHTQADKMLSHNFEMAAMLKSIPFGRTCANIGMSIGESMGMMGAMGIAPERHSPRFATTYFSEMFPSIKQPASDKKVLFFPGCYIDTNDPEVGVAFVKVMNANGYEVVMDSRFKCCGSPLVVAGYLDEARTHADNNVAIISEYAAKEIPTVACCTSCSLMLKVEYTELFAQEEMKEAGKHVWDAFEFLTVLADKGELKQASINSSHKFIYHAPCHLRAQGMGLPALDMLQKAGLNIVNADAGCCGMSGSYGFHKENYETSMKIGADLFNAIKADDYHKAVCDCGTCREQIKHGTGIKTAHPIQILAKAYEG